MRLAHLQLLLLSGMAAYLCTDPALAATSSATLGPVDVSSEDGPVRRCEIFLPLLKLPEIAGLRIKKLASGNLQLHSFTIDVAEFQKFSNGIPFDPVRKPITSARILANTFDSDKVGQLTEMGDGGLGVVLDGRGSFLSLLTLVMRGEYYVSFKRTDTTEVTTYAVGTSVSEKSLKELDACLASMPP